MSKNEDFTRQRENDYECFVFRVRSWVLGHLWKCNNIYMDIVSCSACLFTKYKELEKKIRSYFAKKSQTVTKVNIFSDDQQNMSCLLAPFGFSEAENEIIFFSKKNHFGEFQTGEL